MQKSRAVYGMFPGINQVTISAFLAVTVVLTFCTPAAAIDNTPPAIASTTPSNCALGVSANLDTIAIRFTEPMAASTNYTYSPSLESHTPQWSEDQTRLTLARADPAAPLADGTIVQINLNPHVPGSTNFMEDMAGNHLPAYSFSFAVGQSNPTAPVVVGTQPANGAWNLSRYLPSYSMTFDKPMQPGTCDQLSTHGDQWGSVTKSWSPDGRTVTYSRDHPEIQLRSGAIFTVTLNPEPSDIIVYRDQEDGHKLGTYSFSFTTAIEAPTVVSSLPAHQALDVSPALDTITVNSNEEMADAVSFTEISKIWGSSTYFWSPDHRSLSITRDSAALPLPPGGLVTLMLNPAGAMNFQDLEGNLLDTFSLYFTVAGDAPFQVSRISADPDRGFYWPYYLCVPDETTPFTTLLVEPNNTGTLSDDLAVHEAAAADLVTGRSMFAAVNIPNTFVVYPGVAHTISAGMFSDLWAFLKRTNHQAPA